MNRFLNFTKPTKSSLTFFQITKNDHHHHCNNRLLNIYKKPITTSIIKNNNNIIDHLKSEISSPLFNNNNKNSTTTILNNFKSYSSTYSLYRYSTVNNNNKDDGINRVNIRSETIYALSSGAVKSGVAIVRVSGPNSKDVLEKLTNNSNNNKNIDYSKQARTTILSNLYHPKTDEQIDRGMYVWFPKPNSFTGEDVVEFHIHGGRAVIHDTLEAIGSVQGTRIAEPGEFTKRAFENGKMDLTEVEGLSDLLDAQTNHQRRIALQQMQGSLRRFYLELREQLIRASAYMEAFIDFGDDAEVDPAVVEQSRQKIISIRDSIAKHLADGKRGERLRDGAVITIVGPPNAGKSSLVNLLANRRASIVSPIEGTTRDVIEVMLDIGGYPIVLGDTAGIRNSNDIIEQEGVSMARERLLDSDIKLCLLDSHSLLNPNYQFDSLFLDLLDSNMIFIFNKIDLLSSSTINNNNQQQQWNEIKPKIIKQLLKAIERNENKKQQKTTQLIDSINTCELSCSNQIGIKDLLLKIELQLKEMFETKEKESPLLTRLRHKEHLINCINSLNLYLEYSDTDIVLASEELRNAIRSIGSITYHVNVDDLLDVIFKDFCIGK